MTVFNCLIKINKISQQELADYLGVKRQQVSSWAVGKNAIPEKYLQQLAVKLQVPQQVLKKEIEPDLAQKIVNTIVKSLC